MYSRMFNTEYMSYLLGEGKFFLTPSLFYIHTVLACPSHPQNKNLTEGKAKVVADGWGMYLNAAQKI